MHTHHIRCALGEIGGVFPGHGRQTGPTVIIKTVRAELASGARQFHTKYCRRVFHRVGLVVDQSDSHSSSPTLTKRTPGQSSGHGLAGIFVRDCFHRDRRALLHLVPSLRVHAKGPESRRQRIIPQSAGPKQRPPLVQRRSLDGRFRVLPLVSVR